jgi:hypothetical protein
MGASLLVRKRNRLGSLLCSWLRRFSDAQTLLLLQLQIETLLIFHLKPFGLSLSKASSGKETVVRQAHHERVRLLLFLSENGITYAFSCLLCTRELFWTRCSQPYPHRQAFFKAASTPIPASQPAPAPLKPPAPQQYTLG